MPTYNECANIEAIANRLRAASPDTELLIVDDDSPDGTGELADRIAARDELVHVLHRSQKNGLGEAYRAGFAWASLHGCDVIVEMDADGSHRPEQLPGLLAALENADVVVGSRWVAGGEVVGWPLSRHLLSRGGSAYARVALGIPQRDVTGGYRAYRAEALTALLSSSQISHGYGFQVELLWRAVRSGLRVTEVPISFAERQLGVSKMSAGIVLEAMLLVTRWGLTSIPERLRRSPTTPETDHVHA
ncbi:polyprenol monophosphomannose synthase [Microterricola gilva]|nr:polyprenol monophosphomannose synthase [Microterricola gilva]